MSVKVTSFVLRNLQEHFPHRFTLFKGVSVIGIHLARSVVGRSQTRANGRLVLLHVKLSMAVLGTSRMCVDTSPLLVKAILNPELPATTVSHHNLQTFIYHKFRLLRNVTPLDFGDFSKPSIRLFHCHMEYHGYTVNIVRMTPI